MFNKFKSIFTPKKTKKQNLKYSPYERKSPRNINKIKETNNEQKLIEVAEFEYDKPILKNASIIEKQDEKFIEKEKKVTEKENIRDKKVENENEVQNSNVIKEVEVKSSKDKKEEKKKMDIDDEKNKSKRIKLNTFHYYGTGYSRNSQPYMSARKLQTKKSSVLFYKKKLTNVNKENPNTIKSVPEISNTAKLIFEVVEKEENKYKKPMKMKKLEKKSRSIDSEKKNIDNNKSEAHNKKTNAKDIKRIAPENISKQTDLHFNFIRQSSSYASHPDILVLTKKLSSEDSILPKFSFERKSSSYSFYGSEDEKKPETNFVKKDSSSKPSTSTGFNWAAAGMTKPTLAADEWKCNVCDAKNKNSDDKCVCCEEPNPNKKTSDKPKEPPKFTFGSSSSTITFGKPVDSKSDEKSTTITFGKIDDNKTDNKPASTGFNWAAAGMTKPTLAADEWKCNICDAKNKNTDDKCVCCEEPNPNKKTSDKPKEPPKFTFGSSSSTITFGKPVESQSDEKSTTITFGKIDDNKTDNKSASTGFNWAAAGMTKPTLAADEWKCSICDAKNKNTDDKCICCEEPNPNKKASDKPKEPPKFTFGSSSSTITFGKTTETKTDNKTSETKSDDKPVSNGFNWAAAGMTKPTLAADEWKCNVCDAKNKNSDDKCICCEEPNPNKKASDKPKEPPKFTFGSSSSTITFGKPAENKIDNKTSETKSDDKPVSNGFNWAAAGMTKPTLAADEWKCNVCDAKNKNSDDKCICCEEPNPNKKASEKPKEPPKFTFGSSSSTITFGKPAETKIDNKTSETKSEDKPVSNGFNWAAAGMTKPTLAADEWKCNVCDAKNKNSDDKCVCCEEPNPNKKASDKPKEPPKFTFGSSSSTITFGKLAETKIDNKTSETKSEDKPVSTGFNWAAAGMTKPTLAADEWKCSVCDAKNKNTDDKCICCEEPNPNKKASDKPKEPPKFTFGSSSGNSSITFGASNSKSAITFGQSNNSNSKVTTGFGFGQSFGSTVNSSSNTFTFGNTTTSTSSTKPVGVSSNNTTTNGDIKKTTSGFSFTTSNTTTNSLSFGSTTNSTSKSNNSFSFVNTSNNNSKK